MARVNCEIEFSFRIAPNSAAELEDLIARCERFLEEQGAQEIKGTALATDIPEGDLMWPPASDYPITRL